MHLGYK